MNRRLFLKGSIAVSAIAVNAGLLMPRKVLAAWPQQAFGADSVDGALNKLLGTTSSANNPDIRIKAPEVAANGAVVPVTVSTGLTKVTSINILAANNPTPLAANFDLTPAMAAYVTCRIKMRKTADIIAVIKADGRLFSNRKNVKVTIGGCGG